MSFLSDCVTITKMLRGTVRDEDDIPLSFWEKLGVAWEILCGIIVVGEPRGRDVD